MNGNYHCNTQSTGALPTTRDKNTFEGKQTSIEHTLLHNCEKIKNDSTFNGAALTSDELRILWNKFQMHGHFKVDDNSMSQDTIVSLSSPPNNNSIDQCKWFIDRMPNMYNYSLALDSSKNNMPVYSTVNNIGPAGCINVSDNMLDEFVNTSNQCIHQYLDNSYDPLQDMYNSTSFINTTNPHIYNDKNECITDDSPYSFIDISSNKCQSNITGAQSNEFIYYDNNICHEF